MYSKLMIIYSQALNNKTKALNKDFIGQTEGNGGVHKGNNRTIKTIFLLQICFFLQIVPRQARQFV